MLIFWIFFQMRSKLFNSFSKERNLNVSGAGVFFMNAGFLHYPLFFRFRKHFYHNSIHVFFLQGIRRGYPPVL